MHARPDTKPRVGLILSTQQNDVPVADVLQRARQADKHGLDIWITQQLIPRLGHDWGKTAPETFGMLGALSQITGPGCRMGVIRRTDTTTDDCPPCRNLLGGLEGFCNGAAQWADSGDVKHWFKDV